MTIQRVKTKEAHQLQVALKNLDGKVGKVGWFEKSKYADKDATPVAYVAAIQEYGYPSKNIPARPFMRPTIADKQVEWASIVKQGSAQILKGNQTIGDVLELLGLKASADVKKTISQITTPPLAEATIAARLARKADKNTVGNLTKPLIDTGIMFNTLTNTVEDA